MSAEEIKRKIVVSVSDLVNMELASECDILDWHERVEKVKSLMRLDMGDIRVPHVLWHYLSDVDIRMKDQRYAKAQMLQIKEVLRNW